MKTTSVIITTYNRTEELRCAILSVINQTVPAKEIIVVNDGEVLPESVISDFSNHKIIYLETKETKGVSAARNLGAKRASSDYICFLDDDDEYLKNKIEEIQNVLDNGDFDFIINEVFIFYPEYDLNYKTKINLNKINKNDILLKNELGGIPKLTIKKDVFEFLGGFDECLNAFEDYEFNIRILIETTNYKYVAAPLSICNYVLNKKSVSKSVYASYKNLYRIQTQHGVQKLKLSKQLKACSWRFDILANKAVANRNLAAYITYQAIAFCCLPGLRVLLKILPAFFGIKTLLLVRTWF